MLLATPIARLRNTCRVPTDELVQSSLSRALGSLTMALQPIVRWSTRTTVAAEALMRPVDPVLSSPVAILGSAERLGRLSDVGRVVRERVAELFADLPHDVDLYMNVHPRDLLDPDLGSPEGALGPYAQRIVLEIIERVALPTIDNVRRRVKRLRALGYRIALDDLGAGFADVSSVVLVQPEVVKLDISVVRAAARGEPGRARAAELIERCASLRVPVIAEGVELELERDALLELGCDLFQGYLFARPAPTLPAVTF